MTTLQQFLQDRLRQVPIEAIKLDKPVPLADLHTPALVLDLDIFEANLQKMQAHLSSHGMGLRGHTKMHKSPLIARRQLALGALGVCAATVSEAEVMLAGGINNILITSPVVSAEKIDRVIELARHSSEIRIVVDHIQGAALFNQAAATAAVQLKVLVDLDPGMGRTGIACGEPALALGQYIVNDCPHLEFAGLQMYIGNCMHIKGYADRRARYEALLAPGIATRALFEAKGIAVSVFSGGGTGTFDMEPGIGALTELQAGSYAFMDIEYREIGGPDSELFEAFEPSLFVLVTAISQPRTQLITVDAGFKAFASDSVAPQFRDLEGVVYHWGGDEHGIVRLNNPSSTVRLGDKLAMLTPHCDPTVNLYDYYFPYRNGMVEEIWPVSARGKSQ
ncbi:MAG: DSD1 family PLP-dependent enzyme [Pseudomonadales bacterium]|jgi:3-hydroxy-D-aspartate aldolase|nr:DSD1 family PLP-dependent enzyme [Pseudomonadales bacterium]MDP4639397.1 DSD1 family PLP-dependent enzyme [Pseudomonadales bacterium]MDP4766249.1 DSD1 family PLP-dependent enzyme [Pseudomonadales bacterium]MDP4876123.1 DSD1 family PLP-dependent enzyme [Pseudomonadales bacterium]MDP4911966.1 DSD1 family PLP-dependent enzyme [Pseudomonadales bacterium]